MLKTKQQKIKKSLFEVDQQLSMQSSFYMQNNLLHKQANSLLLLSKNLSDWTNQCYKPEKNEKSFQQNKMKALPKLKKSFYRYSSSLNTSNEKKSNIIQSYLSPVHLKFEHRTIRMQPIIKMRNQIDRSMDRSISTLIRKISHENPNQQSKKVNPVTQRCSNIIRVLRRIEPKRKKRQNFQNNKMKNNGVIITGLLH